MMVQFDVKRVQKGTESFMVSFDFTKTPVTQIVDYVIISASQHHASDIHFDPREEGMMVRFRIDGDCQDYTFVPKAYEKNLTTRIKLLANMNITESRLPQDGAIKGNFGDEYLDMRVSALPLNEGEKVVIRILDYTRSLQGIDSLGFHPKNLEKVKRMMGIPNGIILTTGATGSGKSTTTYSILQGLNKPETNIITVEDPIEMNIEGINQVQVNSDIGMTFAAALRSILRQDPNIILIGEIRDSETAQIAVRASITGHLVLSTIHTNNALATVERLLDMDVERYLLSTALTGIISQRLAKRLCPKCHFQRETTKYEKKVFKKYLHMDIPMVWDANPHGCEDCRKGYHGRLAIHEVLELDDDIRSALNNDKLEKKELAKMVYSGNTITMLQDALIKCLNGETSFEEVYRTIEIENEDDDNYENEINTIIKDAVPKAVVTTESDDLLDSAPKQGDNEISSVITPPAFTAEDFMSEEEKEKSEGKEESTDEKKDGEEKKEEEKKETPEQEEKKTPETSPTTPAPTSVATPAPVAAPTPAPTNSAETSQPAKTTTTPVAPATTSSVPAVTTPQKTATTTPVATPPVPAVQPINPTTPAPTTPQPPQPAQPQKVVIAANGYNSNVPTPTAVSQQAPQVAANVVTPKQGTPAPIKPVVPLATTQINAVQALKPQTPQVQQPQASAPAQPINSVVPITPNKVVPYAVPSSNATTTPTVGTIPNVVEKK